MRKSAGAARPAALVMSAIARSMTLEIAARSASAVGGRTRVYEGALGASGARGALGAGALRAGALGAGGSLETAGFSAAARAEAPAAGVKSEIFSPGKYVSRIFFAESPRSARATDPSTHNPTPWPKPWPSK